MYDLFVAWLNSMMEENTQYEAPGGDTFEITNVDNYDVGKFRITLGDGTLLEVSVEQV